MAIPSRQSMEFLKLHGIPSSTAISGASEKFTRIKANMIVIVILTVHVVFSFCVSLCCIFLCICLYVCLFVLTHTHVSLKWQHK